MLNQADLVEEQELKERIIESLILKYNVAESMWQGLFVSPRLMQQYMMVRRRNETSLREDYRGVAEGIVRGAYSRRLGSGR